MERLTLAHNDNEGANEYAQDLPEEAAFMRKVFESGDCRISIDCSKLKGFIEENVAIPELRSEMVERLVFIMMEMDPALRPQALIQFFQQYYTQFTQDADLQCMIDFVLDYEVMNLLRILMTQIR